MITSKIPNVGISVFETVTGLSNKHNAINLAQGFPDFNCSNEIIELAHKYMLQGKNQYAPLAGVPALRNIIAAKTKLLYGKQYNSDTEITVTAGATQAIYTAITTFIQENDEVIIFEPAYDSYAPAIKINGGKPIHVALKAPEYTIDWAELNQMITARTRMIIINTPHNPTGAILQKSDLEKLAKLISGSNIIVLSDEVYEHIVFDENVHVSAASIPLLADRTIVVSSFGKTLHITGWKVGYMLAPENLTKELRKTHQFQVFTVNTPAQYAIAEYLQNQANYTDLSAFYKKKRDYLCSLLENTQFEFVPAKGTYFQLVDYSELSKEKDMAVVKRMITEVGVALIPVSEFYQTKNDKKILRLCFAKNDEVLKNAVERLTEFKF